MPCNWSTTASFLLRSIQFKAYIRIPSRSYYNLTQLTSPRGHCAVSRDGLLSHLRGLRGLATATVTASQQDSPLPSDDSLSSAIYSTSAQLSPAQISRAAAQAVRLCIQSGEFGDALYLVNSACHSVLQGPLQSGPQHTGQLQPIQFGRPVSPRLAAHAFLHGLIRRGYQRKAGTFAKLMIRAGIHIHTRTLESVVSSLVSRPSVIPKFGPFARVVPRKLACDSPAVMQLRSSMVTDNCTRAALNLLQEARTFGQRRTERMYRVLIETLIMQGEILVASLLFILLLKDFEIRKLQDVTDYDSGGKNYVTHKILQVPFPTPAALRNTPFPNPALMSKILDAIDTSHDPGPGSVASQSLQSLAIFAMLLDTGQIGHSRVAGLISSLYRCPRTDAYVWILRNGKPVRVLAYKYFHDVLKRLINSLSVQDLPSRPALQLSRRSYNTLLSYALRHRLSPEMASVVLHHMCTIRKPPVEPDIVTYNILLRSGTLLRKMDISEAALTVLRATAKDCKVQAIIDELYRRIPEKQATAEELNEEVDRDPSPPPQSSPPSFSGTLRRLGEETLTLPEGVKTPESKLKPDQYTLTSLVMHLTSTGQAEAIAATLFNILPELALVEHPATGMAVPADIPHLHRRTALKRAIAYGPHIYASLINALAKAREVGLAERVFMLAQKAQRASYIPGFSPIAPWRLTVHSYTALMQAYAAIVRGQAPGHKLASRYIGTALLEQVQDTRRLLRMRRMLPGYARFVTVLGAQNRQQRRLTKPQLSRRNAMLLYRSLMSGGRALFEVLMRDASAAGPSSKRRSKQHSQYEVGPDARFFNAVLKLFTPRPKHVAARWRAPSYWRRRWRLAKKASQCRAAVSVQCTPMLERVLRTMVKAGYDVPIGYRCLLAGRWKARSFYAKRRRKVMTSVPYAFPGKGWEIERPLRLPTFKTRGLPVRRSMMKCLLRKRKGEWGRDSA
ncbi:hypothetical protein BD414DRAFT_71518 [Trametes punicea]|nr:hypothetical protein BD414DRAFT_71518 [Trametes punicea]